MRVYKEPSPKPVAGNVGVANEIRKRLNRSRHTLHALQREAKIGITADGLCDALQDGFELVEDYPDDQRGHSCLVLTWIEGEPIHVVCGIHEDILIIITVYIPNGNMWSADFKTRRENE